MPPDPTSYTMSFGDHLEELRRRLFYALAAPLPIFIVAFYFSSNLVELALKPLWDVLLTQSLPMEVQVLTPPEMIMTELKLSAIIAITTSAPWIIWQAWKFVAPGLYAHEQRFVRFLIPGSAVLTVTGVALLYFVMLPLMLHVLVLFGQDVGQGPIAGDAQVNPPVVAEWLADGRTVPVLTAPPAAPAPGDLWLLVPEMNVYAAVPIVAAGAAPSESGGDGSAGFDIVRVNPPLAARVKQVFRVSDTVNFILILMLGVVVAFQMPLVIVLLGWLGLATPEFLRSKRRVALAICGLLAAVLTPADATSMLIMLVPLYGLYELGIVLLYLAPASAVAEGRIWRFGKRAVRPRPDSAGDNGSTDPGQPGEAAQTDTPVPRSAPSNQPRGDQSEMDQAP